MKTLWLFIASCIGFGCAFGAGVLANADAIRSGDVVFWLYFLLGAGNIGGVFAVAANGLKRAPNVSTEDAADG